MTSVWAHARRVATPLSAFLRQLKQTASSGAYGD